MGPDGNIRDRSQPKRVVWMWDKACLGRQPYRDLCGLGGGLLFRGGSQGVACISMLD